MPFESEAQRRYLWANDPEVAKKFADETPKGTKLPARKKRKVNLAARVEALELAVASLARLEFSDSPGHPFHGNQWTQGQGTLVDVPRSDDKRSYTVNVGRMRNGASWPYAHGYSAPKTAEEAHMIGRAQSKAENHGHAQVREHGLGVMGDDTKTTHYKNGEPTKVEQSRTNFGANRELGPKAQAVNLRDFDFNGPDHGLPLPERLQSKSYGAVKFGGNDNYQFTHGSQPRGEGMWIFQHDATGLRVQGNGSFGDVKGGIRETFPRTGDWTVQT